MDRGEKILLLGYMGSGKSIVGRQLATLIQYKNIDLDDYIEEKEQRSIADIFKTHSEIYFRKIEAKYLKEILETKESVILSLGGGTPCYAHNLAQIKQHENVKTIYLEASIKTLTKRLFKEREKRPLISHLTNKIALDDFIRKHLFERSYYYNQAEFKVPVDNKSVTQIVEDIITRLF